MLVFQYWHGLRPALISRCLDSVRAITKNVVVLNDKSASDYFLLLKQRYGWPGSSNPRIRSEYLRCMVLSMHEGLWVDSDVEMFGPIMIDVARDGFPAFERVSHGWNNALIYGDGGNACKSFFRAMLRRWAHAPQIFQSSMSDYISRIGGVNKIAGNFIHHGYTVNHLNKAA